MLESFAVWLPLALLLLLAFAAARTAAVRAAGCSPLMLLTTLVPSPFLARRALFPWHRRSRPPPVPIISATAARVLTTAASRAEVPAALGV